MPLKVEATPDPAHLARTMAALANPTRLALLAQLRLPTPLGELRVAPTRASSDLSTQRVASRQTVRHHLDLLQEEGFVVALDSGEGDGLHARYSVDVQRLFRFTEEVRALSVRFAGHLYDEVMTGSIGESASDTPPRPEWPHLVIAHGAYEGKVFRLDPTKTARIGRQPGLEVALDYDPFVSREHATLESKGGAWLLRDGPGKNPTSLNWRELPSGGTSPVRSGDLIGVGRSLLCVRL